MSTKELVDTMNRELGWVERFGAAMPEPCNIILPNWNEDMMTDSAFRGLFVAYLKAQGILVAIDNDDCIFCVEG